ncbi:MAG: hypothetical protein ABH867_04950, partial [Patescibacteria group bacterium]
ERERERVIRARQLFVCPVKSARLFGGLLKYSVSIKVLLFERCFLFFSSSINLFNYRAGKIMLELIHPVKFLRNKIKTKQFIFFVLIIIVIACGPSAAQAVLDITAPVSATLTGKTVSIAAQTSTGVIGDSDHANLVGVKVSDDGTAGWSAVMTSTHFTTRAITKKLAGNNATVDFTGTYDGLDGVLDPNGTFKVEITAGGAVGTAVFKWWDPAGNLTSTVTTAASVVLSNGITVTFAAATYAVGDSWSAGVDVFPYTDLTVAPSVVYAESGSLTGVSAGSSEALSGAGAASYAKTIMTATAGNGTGIYWQDEDLSLSVHANSLSGDFTATATLTVS